MTDDAAVDNVVLDEPIEPVEAVAEPVEEEIKEPSEPSPEKNESDGVQKRIDKATRKQRDAERDRDYWREQATKEKSEEVKPEPVKLEVKTLEDFDYDEKAYQSYIFETARKEAVDAAKHALQEDRKNSDTKARQKAFEAKEKAFSKTTSDYMDVTRDTSLNLTKDMVDIASSSDNGPALLYYLAKNPDISDSIARLSPLDAARELGRIEVAKLTKEAKSKTDAPPPPKKIDGGNPKISKAPEEMTQKEFNAHRRKVIANR